MRGIDDLLLSFGGAASRAHLLQVLSRGQLDEQVRRGHLIAIFARAYARPWDVDDTGVREAAGVASVGAGSVLTHLSAVRRWGLPIPSSGPVHVATSQRYRPRGRAGALEVHRLAAVPPTTNRSGVATASVPSAIVQSWPMLSGSDQRAPAIVAVRTGLTTTAHLIEAANLARRTTGRAQLIDLLDALTAGVRSELELWGYREVFEVDGLHGAVRQLKVCVAGRTYYLDHAYERERVAVELDGRAYHSGDADWEYTLARDAALATQGWQTLRFSHTRLTREVPGCRSDVLATLGTRRRLPSLVVDAGR